MHPDQDSYTIMPHFPSSYESIKGHMVLTRQGVRSTKKLLQKHPETTAAVPYEEQAKRLHKNQGHHQTNYKYVQYTQASCTQMTQADSLCSQEVETSML